MAKPVTPRDWEFKAMLSRFRYWLGSPQGALVYFGLLYGALAIVMIIIWWR